MNVKTILVPTDFSPHADKAVAAAIDLAKLFGAKIVVAHAYHLEIPMASPLGGAYALPPGIYDDLRSQATEQVERVAQEVAAQGVEATGVALADPASVAILEQAASLPADLIVMGTRGLTGLKHVVLGSVAERVVQMADCPVLTVKGDG